MCKQGVCPLCGEPVQYVEGAKVYHMACLMEHLRPVREACQRMMKR